ncbi:hypothetical protein W822_16760 [Advenella kashmirensis W13003]|uniref:Cytochrome c domain-containing protein n=1 Tax=Advenella kashmirensis W13003 TaxID=1424334 RepID=V8QQ45_9BURK|nr:cytochrome c [Advenella kashmirensis]ETF01440.1 hypothetical protein W822_16760 [Advenella kashmirensis W13003]
MKWFIRAVAAIVVIGILVAGGLFWLGSRDGVLVASTLTGGKASSEVVARGKYLTQIGNCVGCHTAVNTPEFSGGSGLKTQFGTFFAPNITPDPEKGIGRWSADDFWQVLHNGKAPDGSLLYPAFPYQSYSHLSRADSDAIFSYLKTLPASDRQAPAHDLRTPFNMRFLLAFWRALYFRPADAVAQTPASDDAPLRGRHLVDGIAHCAECHTPRNRLGGMDVSRSLQGGKMSDGIWYAPALTGDTDGGLGHWSEQDIADLLLTGLSAHGAVVGPMSEALRGVQYLNGQDVSDIAVYLKSLPAAGLKSGSTGEVNDTLYSMGKKIYGQYCAACHQADGTGLDNAWPSLDGNSLVRGQDVTGLLRVIMDGGFTPTTEKTPQPYGMPPFRHFLNDLEIAAAATYIRNTWSNQSGGVNQRSVNRVRNID